MSERPYSGNGSNNVMIHLSTELVSEGFNLVSMCDEIGQMLVHMDPPVAVRARSTARPLHIR